MLIDTHCHLDFPDFKNDLPSVLSRAEAAGVGFFINVASSVSGSASGVSLAGAHDNIFSSVGVHPHEAKNFSSESRGRLRQLAAHKKVVAIGEVGLDYYRNLSEPEIQKECFCFFVEMASEFDLPLIVHCRQAQQETLDILDQYADRGLKRVVFHCFSGTPDFLQHCIQRGYFVSFTGNVTYPKAEQLREALSHAPMERVFLETDAPFLAPQEERGRRNEPAFLSSVAREVARVKKISFDEVCRQTTQNAIHFFGLKI